MGTMASQLFAAFRIFNGYAPRSSPKSLFVKLDFTISNPLTLDLVVAKDKQQLEWVQTIYIDNSTNSSPLTVTSKRSNQIIVCPPYSQGYFPVLVNNPEFQFSTTGTPLIPVHFLNVAMPCEIWSVNASAVGTNGNVVTGQVKIAVTGTAVALPSFNLQSGVIVKSKVSNSTNYQTVGPAGVTNTVDGTGNGYILSPGEAASFSVPNTNLIYVNGTAGDIFSFEGN